MSNARLRKGALSLEMALAATHSAELGAEVRLDGPAGAWSRQAPCLPGLCDADENLESVMRWTAEHGGKFVLAGLICRRTGWKGVQSIEHAGPRLAEAVGALVQEWLANPKDCRPPGHRNFGSALDIPPLVEYTGTVVG
jgi:hypothetical protein